MTPFRVVYADPAWAFSNVRTGGSLKSGASAKYPTMPVDDICRMDVASVCEDDALLFLWVPTALAVQGAGIKVSEAWGFHARTKMYWHKVGRMGLGFWFRNECEELWLCVRGRVKPFRSSIRNVMAVPVGKHSQKPMEFRRVITDLTTGPRLEMFARPNSDEVPYKTDDWWYHGNEMPRCFPRTVEIPMKG
jgi:site-specific DNA-methyltransferase (adenine-specific)